MPTTDSPANPDQTVRSAPLRRPLRSRRRLLTPLAGTVLAVTLGAGGAATPGDASNRGPVFTTRPAAFTTADTSGHAARGSTRGTRLKSSSSRFGRVLTDGRGRTIYLFTRESSKTSKCYGACASAWPPVLTKGTPKAGRGLSARVGTTRRRNGAVQVTYGGHPLYYFVGDRSPGQITCQNVDEFGGTWLVVSPQGSPVR